MGLIGRRQRNAVSRSRCTSHPFADAVGRPVSLHTAQNETNRWNWLRRCVSSYVGGGFSMHKKLLATALLMISGAFIAAAGSAIATTDMSASSGSGHASARHPTYRAVARWPTRCRASV